MSKVVGPNAPCPCGSGKKYKKCHGAVGATRGKIPPLYWILALVAVAALAFWFGQSKTRDVPSTPSSFAPGEAPAGKVWSAEHGHWHDAP